MDKILKKKIDQILNYEIDSDKVYSIHSKWLSEEETQYSLMCFKDIKTFSDYEKMKLIEDKYLGLLVNLDTLFKLKFIDVDTLEVKSELDFNFLLNISLGHIINDNELIFTLLKDDIIIVLSHDFNIYVYNKESNQPFEKIHEIFLENSFYELPK